MLHGFLTGQIISKRVNTYQLTVPSMATVWLSTFRHLLITDLTHDHGEMFEPGLLNGAFDSVEPELVD